jgi:hypothetical protein
VVRPGVVRIGDPVDVEPVQHRQGVLATTIETLAAGLAANP